MIERLHLYPTGPLFHKALTGEQAWTLLAFIEATRAHASGEWGYIKDTMLCDFGIEAPEKALAKAQKALL